jgi:hypothetical protein
MKKFMLPALALCACLFFSGCGLMEMSFKAGFIMALILAAIIGLLIWILHFSWKLLGKHFPNMQWFLEGFWTEE